MDSSRRAVESYWRSRMIDTATCDEDKVTPVYKLEEICELLRSSHVSIVKEVSEFIFKRLDHKSPIVKQKALRLIKYSVGKSGVEFRRELQRNSVAIRQLIHYKGQPDPLKGDALNKSVRATAQEALSAMFSTEDNKPAAPSDDLTQRIQGFGSTNYEMPSEDKKSFLSEVVGLGSATIKQGLNSLSQAPANKRIETGSYRSPNLRRSLTTEIDHSDRYEGDEYRTDTQPASRLSNNTSGGTWAQDLKTMDTANSSSSSSHSEIKTREERLLETIVTSGGVRLQPTRDALHLFLVQASKLDPLALCYALETKLQSHSWQVRVRAVCVLDAILRKKEDENFSVVASYFSDNIDVVVKCCESPQASLREKANKVLGILEGEQTGNTVGNPERQVKAEATAIQMPDLIDTGDSDGPPMHQSIEALTTPATLIVDDLFGDGPSIGVSTSEQNKDDDPFADVSFHTNNDKEHVDDIFSGMTTDSSGARGAHMTPNQNGAELYDIFGSKLETSVEQLNNKKDVNDLMSSLFIKENDVEQQGTSSDALSENIFSVSSTNLSHQVTNDPFNKTYSAQLASTNANPLLPVGTMPYNMSPGMMFNPAIPSQPINYGAMGNLLAQQQFLAAMSNYQQLGNLHPQNSGFSQAVETQGALPDVFNSSLPVQTSTSVMNGSKKEETRAFDFISDHLAAARDTKRVI
ncbi:protein MODIFIED TRANSPORT TO THE VACUOLE 1 [Heracleum sosnowskyi]|uniref:Protein MODIFIED TRANSPORT TO THE VACUOLE 1 n=1 Tax=Heracleum sosnowskyi TaxID=360622 RepID=A0AAD8HJ50_9APIA|nr:protein MODIFIED TRANSPORT TO THE VACUOLE 1 [Heracleum sosnowskyi]